MGVKIALERVPTNHIEMTMEIPKHMPLVRIPKCKLLPYPSDDMQEVEFEVTDRTWNGYRVFREIT